MANEITISKSTSIIPQTYDECMKLSHVIHKSGLASKSFNSPEQVFIAIQYGADVGLSPMQSVQNVSVISGKPGLSADAMLAVVMASGLLEQFDEQESGESDTLAARCTVKRKGRSAVTITFGVTEATKAGLWKKAGPWTQYPGRMLKMRARSFALRDTFPDILKGLCHATEELQDIVIEPQNVTPESKFEEVTVVQTSDTYTFIDSTGNQTQAMNPQTVFDYIEQKLDNIWSQEDLENFNTWRALNDEEFKRYGKAHYKDAKSLAELKEHAIKRLADVE